MASKIILYTENTCLGGEDKLFYTWWKTENKKNVKSMLRVQHILPKESETILPYVLLISATYKIHTLYPKVFCSFSGISDLVFDKPLSGVKISFA